MPCVGHQALAEFARLVAFHDDAAVVQNAVVRVQAYSTPDVDHSTCFFSNRCALVWVNSMASFLGDDSRPKVKTIMKVIVIQKARRDTKLFSKKRTEALD